MIIINKKTGTNRPILIPKVYSGRLDVNFGAAAHDSRPRFSQNTQNAASQLAGHPQKSVFANFVKTLSLQLD